MWDANSQKWIIECEIGDCGMTSAIVEREGAQYIDVTVKVIRDIDEFQALFPKLQQNCTENKVWHNLNNIINNLKYIR